MENKTKEQVQTTSGANNGGNKKLFIIIGAAVAALLIIIFAITTLFPSPKSVANKYFSGYKSLSANKVLSTMHPKMKSEVKEDIKDEFKEAKEEKVKVKKVKLDSDYEEVKKEELKFIAKFLEKEYDIKESSVKAVRRYEADVTVSVDGDEDDIQMGVTVVKIGMKWYVMG